MQYYYSQDGSNQQGPASIDGLKAAKITAATLVWADGMSGWTPAGQVPELASLFQPQPSQVVNPPQQYGVAPASPGAVASAPGGPYVNYRTTTAAQQTNNGLAVASLVLGIVGMVTGCLAVPSILAIVFGHMARAQIRRGEGGGDGMALAGLIMGYIMTALTVLVIVFYILIAIFAVGAAATASNNNTTFRPTPMPAPTPIPVPRPVPRTP